MIVLFAEFHGSLGAWTDDVAPFIANEIAARPGYPNWLPYGWIDFESGGRIGDITTGTVPGGEYSYFQLTQDDINSLGVDVDRLRTDPEYAIYAGFLLIDKTARTVDSELGTQSTDAYFKWIKYVHSIGSCGFTSTIDDLNANGVNPWDWDTVRDYYSNSDNDLRASAQVHVSCGSPHQPSNAIRRVDQTFDKGVSIALQQGLDPYAGVAVTPATASTFPWKTLAVATALTAVGYIAYKKLV